MKLRIGKNFWPLATTLAAIVVLGLGRGWWLGDWSALTIAASLTGFFLIIFGGLKLFDWADFSAAFADYDFLAGRFSLYAKAYPFWQIILGILLLGGDLSLVANLLVLAVALSGGIGLWRLFKTDRRFTSRDLNSWIKLPMIRVLFLENVLTGGLAAISLIILIV